MAMTFANLYLTISGMLGDTNGDRFSASFLAPFLQATVYDLLTAGNYEPDDIRPLTHETANISITTTDRGSYNTGEIDITSSGFIGIAGREVGVFKVIDLFSSPWGDTSQTKPLKFLLSSPKAIEAIINCHADGLPSGMVYWCEIGNKIRFLTNETAFRFTALYIETLILPSSNSTPVTDRFSERFAIVAAEETAKRVNALKGLL